MPNPRYGDFWARATVSNTTKKRECSLQISWPLFPVLGYCFARSTWLNNHVKTHHQTLLRTERLSFGSLHMYIVYPSIHILVICSVELDYRNCQILTDYTMNKHQNSKGNSDIYLIFYPLLPLSNCTHRQLNRTLFITQPHWACMSYAFNLLI